MDGVFVDFCTPFSGPGLGQVLREELDTLKAKRQELRKEISVNRQNLKNALKKQQKLVKTAKQLSLSDLRKLVTAAEAAQD